MPDMPSLGSHTTGFIRIKTWVKSQTYSQEQNIFIEKNG